MTRRPNGEFSMLSTTGADRRRLIGAAAALWAPMAWAGAYDDFIRAVATDDVSAVQALLRRGVDVNLRDEKGQPALTVALRDGQLRVADALLRAPGLEVDAPNADGETPLMMAALKGHLDAARQLIERGARLELEGWTPLHYAATGPSTALVQLLLDRGARVDVRSPNGSTPLMMAARYGQESSVDALLSRGADPALRNERDMNASDFARSVQREALADRLARPGR